MIDKTVFNSAFSFDLRAQSFEEESQFVIFTGTAISGKTSVLDALGVPYEPEVARTYIECELAKGRTKEDIRKDEGEFQQGLVNAKRDREKAAPKDTLHYFDRAMPDSITYHRAAGIDPSYILSYCKKTKYAHVFHFEPLPDEVVAVVMAQDSVRTEDLKTRALIDEWLQRDYASLGYEVTFVPVMPIDDRKEFVLAKLLSRRLAKLNAKLCIPEGEMERRGMPAFKEVSNLVEADKDPENEPICLTPRAAAAWQSMKSAASASGITLWVQNGFRSIDTQADLIRSELKNGSDIQQALTWIAAPGYSEHHTGRAIDIACPDCYPVTQEFDKTEAFAWLKEHASEFGFTLTYPPDNTHGIIYEPWHWCLDETGSP